MSVAASLSRSTMTVDAGASVSCDVVVHNRSDVVDQLAVELVGDAAGWVTAVPDTVNLMPGTSGTVTLTFAPPRTSEVLAGTVPFGVRVRSREHPAVSVVEEGEIEIRPFTALSAELVPTRRHARRLARFRLAVENTGNQPVDVAIGPVDVDPVVLDVRPDHPTITARPGTVTLVRTKVAARRRFLRGEPKQHPFQLTLSEVDTGEPAAEPIVVAGTLIQERLLPKWLLPALAVLAAVTAGLVAVWFALLKPAVQTVASEQVAPKVAEASRAAAAAQDAAVKADVAAAGGGAGGGAARPQSPQSATAAPSTPAPGAGAGGGLVEFRIAANAKPVTDGSYQRFSYTPPDGKPVALGDMVLQNPRGDTGFLRVLIGDSVVLESGLANFRDLDYHYVNPLRADKGVPVRIEVNCLRPGAGATACTPSVSFSGTTVG